MTASRSVSWQPVAEFVAELLARANTTPPAATLSSSRRCARLSACTGGWRSRSRQRAKVAKSWSSRSLRSVSTTSVGLPIAGSRMMRPA